MSSRLAILALLGCVLAAASVQAILSGFDAQEHKFPYQVSLRRNNVHTCGGTIISPNYILTAVHCVAEVPKRGRYILRKPHEFTIQAGSIDRTKGGVVVGVSEITAHEHYGINLNDVAVMKLKQPLKFSNTIKPIPLSKEEPPINAAVVVSGWGRLSDNGIRPDILQWIGVRHISRKDCAKRTQIDTDQVICMDHPIKQGPCKGDSGGPAVYQKKLVGINSFLINGCGTNKPDFYVNVAKYLPWIEKHTDISI